MASVSSHGNGIRIRITHESRRNIVQIDLPATKANLKAVRQRAELAQAKLRLGEPWGFVKAWLRNEQPPESVIVDEQVEKKTLGYWAQHYLDVIAPDYDGIADSTLMGYTSAYNSNWLRFDRIPICDIQLGALQTHLSSRPVSNKTKREALSTLKRIYKTAGLKTLDDWQMKKTKAEKNRQPDPYGFEERDKLIKALKPWPIAQTYFTFAFYTGMRTGELLGLHWSDYEEGEGFTVWQSMVRRQLQPHVKTKRRYVLAHPKAIEALREHPTRFEGGLIFKTPEGRMFKDADWLTDKWKRAHVNSGVRRRLGPYQWRHTYISMCLSGGMSIYDVAKQSGNSPQIIEEAYESWIPREEYLKKLRQQLTEAL
ncbi:MAG: tyrosine-type recombinase/integrase [Pseudomonadales bacterium]|nr:tyrosine-type recombinase/integrase [Pseudomonadales bacterium]